VDRRLDPKNTSLGLASIREFDDSFHREHGCEGANAGKWQHIIKTPGGTRKQMMHATSLRDAVKDNRVVPFGDNRSDICIVEMMGKKRWFNSRSANPRAAPPPVGDARMHHLSVLHVEAEPDDNVRRLRTRQPPRPRQRSTYKK